MTLSVRGGRDVSLIADIRLGSADDAVSAALSAGDGLTGTIEDVTATDPEQPVYFVWVSGDTFEPFRRSLDQSPAVRSADRLEAEGNQQLFRICAEREPSVYRAYVERGGALIGGSVSPDCWQYRLRFPDRDALLSFRSFCADADLEFSLHGLARGNGESSMPTLTDPQREALETALDAGYFAVPRETQLAGVADRLDISEQATSERLRRGEATVVGRMLENGDR